MKQIFRFLEKFIAKNKHLSNGKRKINRKTEEFMKNKQHLRIILKTRNKN